MQKAAAAQGAPVKTRERWIDVAKGIAIILVVFLHSSFDYLGDSHVWRWAEISSILETFRMPLFFFTAGIFASGALSKSFRELLNTRVFRFAWLYVLWSVIAIFTIERLFVGFDGWGAFAFEFLQLFVMPYASTWFIYAIAVYFIAAWLIRRLPLVVQVVIGVAATILFHYNLFTPPDSEWAKVGEYFLFFLLAVEFGPRLRRFVPTLRWWHTLIAPAVYVGLLVLLGEIGWIDAGEGSVKEMISWFALSVLAVAAGSSVAILIARWTVFDWLYHLGSRTLQVYLLHWYVLAACWYLLSRIAVIPGAVQPFLVPILMAVAICGSLLIWRLTRRASFLYAKPAWLELPTPPARRPAIPRARDASDG